MDNIRQEFENWYKSKYGINTYENIQTSMYEFEAWKGAKDKYESKWISVNDRLPNRYDTVLVNVKSGNKVSIARFMEDFSGEKCFLIKWGEHEDRFELVDITHWKPIDAFECQHKHWGK